MTQRSDYQAGAELARDCIIGNIIAFQNEKYWRADSEGYQALQDLLMWIQKTYGKMYGLYKF